MLEDPSNETIAGHINDIVVIDDNDFYLFIDFFNYCSSVNKSRGKDLEDIIDEVGIVQITVVKSPGVEIANTDPMFSCNAYEIMRSHGELGEIYGTGPMYNF